MLSRTASTLYWMSRFVERAENTARILDVTWRMSLLIKEQQLQNHEWFAPLNITGTLYPFSGRHTKVCADQVLHYMVLDLDNPSSILSCARQARENARAVRGSITSEMWEVINGFWLELQRINDHEMIQSPSEFFERVKERSHLFRGVTFGTMRRDDAYFFARLGTHIERADSTARILDVKYHILLPSVKDVGGAVDYYQWSAVLRCMSAFEAYRKQYKDVITPRKLAELMIFNADVPRSLRFCMREVCATLEQIKNQQSGETLRRAGEIHANLQFGLIDRVFSKGLHEYLTQFLNSTTELGVHIHQSFFAPRVMLDAA
jgi:uncharacterized alpha-E superfamily protein